ncbi:ATP-binding protein [Desulfovibrio sp. JC010]|uniref:ATP-binding protein n=1 Tax=Desulfovibrio sp. JC010 TaxID=2593641 RepID=UPI0013D82632|nr:ATP-binding protein [Desulfovibrio sp. JC010]NDV27532.1 ATP-binding protein [Desulfovibrio sp. JC010]
MYLRNITQELVEALEDSPVLFLRGARQVGKSTLVKNLLSDAYKAKYVTLDNATSLALAADDPTAFIAGQPKPLIIDEVQRVPELLLAIKEAVDNDRKPGQFLLTGSANLLTLPLVSDSLAGRMEIQTLWPLAQVEIHRHKADFVETLFNKDFIREYETNEYDLPEMIVTGGYPEVMARKSLKRRDAWFESYLTSIIERDIRDIARIQETAVMLKLVRLLATRTANQLNLSELSRTMQIPNATLRRYMDLLEKVFLIHFLPAWGPNLGKRLVKSPKLYLVDCGLAAHLMGADADRLKNTPELAGQLVETFVVNEVLKHLTWSNVSATPYHFRTHAGLEVDMVLEKTSGEIACIEIKQSAQVAPKHFRGLKTLKEDLGDKFKAGVVLYGGKDIVPFGEDLFAVPISMLWR